MDSRRLRASPAAIVALFFALTVGAQDSSAPTIEKERKVEMWSIALIGPAAMIFIVTALGLTITFRSLRKDFRHQRSLDHYWRHGAMTLAKNSRD